MHEKDLIALSCHIIGKFADNGLLEGFCIFDPVRLSQDLTLQAMLGAIIFVF